MMELSHAPYAPFLSDRLPGMAPLAMGDWLQRDEAFAPQMAYRDRLVAERSEIVLAGEGCRGSGELVDMICANLAAYDPDYVVGTDHVIRPDGVRVVLDPARPFATLARLVQEDLLILHRPDGAEEHILTGAALLFPSRWSLQEKMGQPLVAIHRHVPAYDDGIAPRVQRLFDALRPDRPLVRANWLVHPTPELHQPRRTSSERKHHERANGQYWLRVERQSIMRLPRSDVVVFSVKTVVTPVTALSPAHRAGLIRALAEQSAEMREYHGGSEYNDTALTWLRAL
ncbi:MAG: DUF3445 domain-containing protein [Pseudomonadota bacterium]